MQTNNNTPAQQDSTPGKEPLRDEKVAEALRQAEHDIEEDPDFQDPGPTADMDEGEIARFEAGEDPREQPSTSS